MGGFTAMQPSKESQIAADLANATVALTLLGGLTGLLLGFAGGLACRSPARGIKVALFALLAGAIVAVLASHSPDALLFSRPRPRYE